MGKETLLRRIFNRNTQGSVAPGDLHLDREQEILSVLNPSLEVQKASDDRSDLWGGEMVSIETERENTLELQEKLDAEVTQENRGIYKQVRGLLPCQRVKKDS